MIIYPAIDLKDGNCVRLVQGKMDEETIFSVNPPKQAKRFADAGFEWIHVVDLNGAVEGKPKNVYAVSKIIKTVNIPVQLGGGVRDMVTAEQWMKAGVSRLIIGTMALEHPEIVKEMAKEFPGKIAVGIDAKNGMVATHGWVKTSETKVEDLAKAFEDAGICAIIHTDIARDGIMKGPNVEETSKLADAVNIPIIASGGVSGLADVEALRGAENIAGVIIGRALYDGAISAEELMRG